MAKNQEGDLVHVKEFPTIFVLLAIVHSCPGCQLEDNI
jgi:hypothetical protein